MSDPVLQGEITSISSKFWQEGWGYGTARAIQALDWLEKGGEIKITGPLQGLVVGDSITATGEFVEDRYGVSFKCKSVMKADPRTAHSAKRWLNENLPQIGPQRSLELVKRFGDGIWDIIEQDPYRMTEVPGITPDRVKQIVAAWDLHKASREKHVALYAMGLTQREAKLVDKTDLTLEEIQAAPFFLYHTIPSMTFRRCDLICDTAQGDPQEVLRLAAAAVQAVQDAASEGHTGMYEQDLIHAACGIGEISQAAAEHGLTCAIQCDYLVMDDGMIMLPHLRDAEIHIAAKLHKLSTGAKNDDSPGSDATEGAGDDDARTGRSGDWGPGDGQEHNHEELPGADAQDAQHRDVRTDG